MALRNPAINPPSLTSSRRPRLHSRSPSRSPVRHHARDVDPLLRDLSPTTTLRALTNEPSSVTNGSHEPLPGSLDTATSSERALGAKAAQACIDLRSWARELEGWEWPGTFDEPEPARKRMRMSGMSYGSIVSSPTATIADDETLYWGSLPARTVQDYDKRSDEIVQQLDQIDVEELKHYILSAHQAAGAGSATADDSLGAIGAATDLRQLDDFTALITATILQALPYLSRLNRLLDDWTIRLAVLRKAPDYLDDLRQARRDLDHGWAAIAVSPIPAHGLDSANFTRETMATMKLMIEQQVTSLGRRLDRFLDELEGREETVPDAWIEDFETLESAYGDWVVQAERKALENEWRVSREENEPHVEHPQPGELLDDSGMHQRETSNMNGNGRSKEEDGVLPPDSESTDGMSELSPIPSVTLEQLEPYKPLENDPHALANDENERAAHMQSAEQPEVFPGINNHPSGNSLTSSSTKHSRHVPIITYYNGNGESEHNPDVAGGRQADSDAIVPLPALPETTPLASGKASVEGVVPGSKVDVKKRAAFLDADNERERTLQKQVKSPVRPFEHASNAFTRLFKKDRPGMEGRTGSQRSMASQKSSSSKQSTGSKSEKGDGEGILWGGLKPLSPVSSGSQKSISDARTPTPTSRSRASSVKSGSTSRDRGAKRVVMRDYPDMPGGFRPRSNSDEPLRRIQSRSRSHSATPKEHVLQTRVETYQPRRVSSPFRLDSEDPAEQGEEYPADWPLASPPDTQTTSPLKGQTVPTVVEESDGSPEIKSPPMIESDAFDRMFVESLPNTPEGQVENPLEKRRSSKSKRRKHQEPTLDEFMLGPSETPGGLTLVSSISPSSNAHFAYFDQAGHELQPPHTHVVSEPGPEPRQSDANAGITHEASESDYFHAQPLPNPVQRHADTLDHEQRKSKSVSPISPRVLKLKIPDLPNESAVAFAEDEKDGEWPILVKRASVASIASHLRAEVRSVDIPRRGSVSSVGSHPATPRDSAPVSAVEPGSARRPSPSPLSYNGALVFPTSPAHRSSVPASPVSPVSMERTPVHKRQGSQLSSSPLTSEVTSPTDAASPEPEIAPLNAAMSKRQDKKAQTKIANGGVYSPEPLKPGEDTFDRHVSEVLDRLPSAHIKFKTRPGAETPVTRTSEPRNYAGPRPKTSRIPSKTGAGDLTLAPAEVSPKKATESEVKLYHLTQAGKDEPIKLFVRLVGEGERVMVRVGGGWADLADYLRQYAEHHGSRTVSGSGVEVHTAESNPMSRRVSGPVDTKSRTPVTPASAGPRPGSRDTDGDWLAQPQPSFNMGDSTPTDDGSPVRVAPYNQTPTNMSATQRSPPKSASSKGSRPSTADSTMRPDSRQGWMEGGLAGPLSRKRSDLPEQKAKWVEGMIEKAKAASAEKSKEDRAKYFGELGKTGGTRRVVFRSSSGMGSNGANGKTEGSKG